MHIVLGATGHVGSATAVALLDQGQPVTIITHDEAKREAWRGKGAAVAVVDVHDSDALRQVFRSGSRAFLLNPPAAPSTDTDVEEHRTLSSIVAALDGSGLEKVVAESTYGAQPRDRCGDFNILFDFEEALRAQPIPVSIIRAAYYMSNWDSMVGLAKGKGVVSTMYPADLAIPMVAPSDLGRTAARLMCEPTQKIGVHYVEGPERYSSADVAEAFAVALGKPVKPDVVPRDKWEETYLSLGFSEAAAKSYTCMTGVSVDGGYEMPPSPERGEVTLQAYVSAMIRAAGV